MHSDALFELRPTGSPDPTVHILTNKGAAWAKVGLPGERFWCKIESVDGDGMVQMTIDNTLRASTLRAGDRIALPRKHVLDVATTADLHDWMHGTRTRCTRFGSQRRSGTAQRCIGILGRQDRVRRRTAAAHEHAPRRG